MLNLHVSPQTKEMYSSNDTHNMLVLKLQPSIDSSSSSPSSSEFRRIAIPFSAAKDWHGVCALIAESLGLPQSPTKIGYVDQDHDHCVITNQFEWNEALRQAMMTSSHTLKLDVPTSGGSNWQSSAPFSSSSSSAPSSSLHPYHHQYTHPSSSYLHAPSYHNPYPLIPPPPQSHPNYPLMASHNSYQHGHNPQVPHTYHHHVPPPPPHQIGVTTASPHHWPPPSSSSSSPSEVLLDEYRRLLNRFLDSSSGKSEPQQSTQHQLLTPQQQQQQHHHLQQQAPPSQHAKQQHQFEKMIRGQEDEKEAGGMMRARKSHDDSREIHHGNITTGLHPRIECNSCGQRPIRGFRFKCTFCEDFDLCQSCMNISNVHPIHHPFIRLAPTHQLANQKRIGSQMVTSPSSRVAARPQQYSHAHHDRDHHDQQGVRPNSRYHRQLQHLQQIQQQQQQQQQQQRQQLHRQEGEQSSGLPDALKQILTDFLPSSWQQPSSMSPKRMHSEDENISRQQEEEEEEEEEQQGSEEIPIEWLLEAIKYPNHHRERTEHRHATADDTAATSQNQQHPHVHLRQHQHPHQHVHSVMTPPTRDVKGENQPVQSQQQKQENEQTAEQRILDSAIADLLHEYLDGEAADSAESPANTSHLHDEAAHHPPSSASSSSASTSGGTKAKSQGSQPNLTDQSSAMPSSSPRAPAPAKAAPASAAPSVQVQVDKSKTPGTDSDVKAKAATSTSTTSSAKGRDRSERSVDSLKPDTSRARSRTVSPAPTSKTSPSPSAIPLHDITLPEGAAVFANSSQNKKWLVLNNGTAPWPHGSKLQVDSSSDSKLVCKTDIPVPIAKPNEAVEVGATITAPSELGYYKASFVLTDKDGKIFKGPKMELKIHVVENSKRSGMMDDKKSKKSKLNADDDEDEDADEIVVDGKGKHRIIHHSHSAEGCSVAPTTASSSSSASSPQPTSGPQAPAAKRDSEVTGPSSGSSSDASSSSSAASADEAGRTTREKAPNTSIHVKTQALDTPSSASESQVLSSKVSESAQQEQGPQVKATTPSTANAAATTSNWASVAARAQADKKRPQQEEKNESEHKAQEGSEMPASNELIEPSKAKEQQEMEKKETRQDSSSAASSPSSTSKSLEDESAQDADEFDPDGFVPVKYRHRKHRQHDHPVKH